MMITKARRRPNTAATTPSIGAETSAWKPSRVAGTMRLVRTTAATTAASVTTNAPNMISVAGTEFSRSRSTLGT